MMTIAIDDWVVYLVGIDVDLWFCCAPLVTALVCLVEFSRARPSSAAFFLCSPRDPLRAVGFIHRASERGRWRLPHPAKLSSSKRSKLSNVTWRLLPIRTVLSTPALISAWPLVGPTPAISNASRRGTYSGL